MLFSSILLLQHLKLLQPPATGAHSSQQYPAASSSYQQPASVILWQGASSETLPQEELYSGALENNWEVPEGRFPSSSSSMILPETSPSDRKPEPSSMDKVWISVLGRRGTIPYGKYLSPRGSSCSVYLLFLYSLIRVLCPFH